MKIVLPRLKGSENLRGQVPFIMQKFFITQLVMSLLSIMFGTSMLIAHLLPELFIDVVLFVNGCILIYLMFILIAMDKVTSHSNEKP